MIRIILLFCLSYIGSCKNSYNNTITEVPIDFNAIVEKEGLDCGNAPLVTIYVDGKPSIQPVYGINFPDSLRIEGMKLLLEWRKPKPEEKMMCHTLGPGYGQLYIVKAKRAE